MDVVVQSAAGSTARFRVYEVLYSPRRYQLNVTATPVVSSCWMPAPHCRLYSREKFASSERFVIRPKLGLLLGPSSLSWAISSPLTSVHVRVSVKVAIGLNRFANVLASGVMYLPKLAFNAVLPSPNTSYARPRRGDHDFQQVMPG